MRKVIEQGTGGLNMTNQEKETALLFAAALMMQEVVYSKALDALAKNKLRENALILKNMADKIRGKNDVD